MSLGCHSNLILLIFWNSKLIKKSVFSELKHAYWEESSWKFFEEGGSKKDISMNPFYFALNFGTLEQVRSPATIWLYAFVSLQQDIFVSIFVTVFCRLKAMVCQWTFPKYFTHPVLTKLAITLRCWYTAHIPILTNFWHFIALFIDNVTNQIIQLVAFGIGHTREFIRRTFHHTPRKITSSVIIYSFLTPLFRIKLTFMATP